MGVQNRQILDSLIVSNSNVSGLFNPPPGDGDLAGCVHAPVRPGMPQNIPSREVAYHPPVFLAPYGTTLDEQPHVPGHRCTGDTERRCDFFPCHPGVLYEKIKHSFSRLVEGIGASLAFADRPAVCIVPQKPAVVLR